MKHAKKLASLLLALAMVLSMSITTFAAPTPDESTASDHTYQIYQIFTGDYSGGVLSNVKWGANAKNEETAIKVGDPVPEGVLTALTNLKNETSDTVKLETIQNYADLTGTPFCENSATKYTDMPNGYYLIRDKANTQDGEDQFYTLYIVQVVDTVLEITPKGDVPSSDKKIVEGENRVDLNEASIGEEVNYEITGTMPTNIADYKEYYYVFTDTLSEGLTFKDGSVKVEAVTKINETTTNTVDLTDKFYKKTTTNEDGTTTLTVGVQNLLWYKDFAGITKDTKIVVTYTATLNEKAVVAGTGNTNDVTLEYSNDPNNSGDGTTNPPDNPKKPEPTHPTGDTPTHEVVTYTTELTILKTDEAGEFLPGAEFTLSCEGGVKIVLVTKEEFVESETEGTYYKLKNGKYTETAPTIAEDETDNSDDYEQPIKKYKKVTSVVQKGENQTETDVKGLVDPSTGKVTFTGLGAGSYTIKETKTPTGYNTAADITFDLTFDAANKKFVSSNEDIIVGGDNKLDTSVINRKGTVLPSTGGIGTTIFYVVGAILMIGAGVMLVTKKRMSEK